MFSLNVPVPGTIKRLAGDLRPALLAFESIRERHTLVLKRLGGDPESYDRIEGEVRRVLAGAPTVEARITGICAFDEPVSGPGPVVYLAVESPGIHLLHDRLVEELGAIEGLEGEAYTPHVTLARDGPPEAVDRLRERSIDPITWTVNELHLVDARGRERVGTISLPA